MIIRLEVGKKVTDALCDVAARLHVPVGELIDRIFRQFIIDYEDAKEFACDDPV